MLPKVLPFFALTSPQDRLIQGCSVGDLVVVKAAITYGASLSVRGWVMEPGGDFKRNLFPLEVAVRQRSLPVVAYLLSLSPDVEPPCAFELCSDGEIWQLLIDAGCDINCISEHDGRSRGLYHAVSNSSEDGRLVQLLLAQPSLNLDAATLTLNHGRALELCVQYRPVFSEMIQREVSGSANGAIVGWCGHERVLLVSPIVV